VAKKSADPNKKTRQKTTRRGERLKEWRKIAAAAAANASDLPTAEVPRQRLEKVIGEMDSILVEQGLFQSNKQQASQRLQTLANQGTKLATVLKVVVKQHYGHDNDKLVEFGIQPFRSRPRTTQPTVAPPTTPGSGTPSPTPPPTAK
jgi:hypothetical protein